MYAPVHTRNRGGTDHPCTQKLSAVCEVPAQFTFEVSTEPADWTTAESACKKLGGNLAHIQSFGENGRATEACQTERCWMGLNDRYREGDWQFTDGSALSTGFTNWVPGEPDDTKYPSGIDEDCAYLHGKVIKFCWAATSVQHISLPP